MTVPAVVEKQLFDIDLSKGVNESDSPYSVDWTKYLLQADNVDLGKGGELKPRAGLVGSSGLEKSPTDVSFSTFMTDITPVGRLLSTSRGLLSVQLGGSGDTGSVVQSRSMKLRALDEAGSVSDGSWSLKNRLGEFSVTPVQAGAGNATTVNVVGSAYTTNYYVACYQIIDRDFQVLIIDKASGNIVRALVVLGGLNAGACITALGEKLHLYVGDTTAVNCYCYQFDLTSSATVAAIDLTVNRVLLTGGTRPAACAPMGTTSSVVLFENGNLSRVDTSMAEVNTGAVPVALTSYYDITANNTYVFVAGFDAGNNVRVDRLTSAFAASANYVAGAASPAGARVTIGCSSAGASPEFYVNEFFNQAIGAGGITIPRMRVRSDGSTMGSIADHVCIGNITSPFYCAENNKFFASVVDLPQAGAGTSGHNTERVLGANIILGLSEYTAQGPYVNFYPPAAVADSFTDWSSNSVATGWVKPQKAFTADSGKTFTQLSLQKTGPGSFAAELRVLRLNDVSVVGCSDDVISGGRTSIYDGVSACELGCLQTPCVTADNAGAGSIAAGSYSYVVLYEFTDCVGRRHFSKCSNPVTITLGGASNVTVSFTVPTISWHSTLFPSYQSLDGSGLKIHVYRTVNGGTQYYRVTSTASPSASIYQITDSVTDATLQTKELLHRQPGTAGTALDRFYAPSSACVVRHKDRVFLGHGTKVFYSSFDVFGEAPWFNPAFSFEVPGGSGDITALASVDGLLVIFKRNSVFVVDGDGPPENGGNGSEFSPPRRVSSEIGCVDQRTLVYTRAGVMFRSEYSIETLKRNMTIEATGRMVQSTLDAHLYNGGAAYDPTTSRVVWIVGTLPGTYRGQLESSGTGYALVYNTETGGWTRYVLRSNTGYGYAFQDVAAGYLACGLLSLGKKSRLVFADSHRLYFESGHKDTVASTDYFVPITLRTGYARSESKQDRVRVSDFIVAAYRNAAAKLTVSYAYDYGTSYTSIKTFGTAVTDSLTVAQLETQPPKEAVQSVSFKIESSDPSPASYGTGQQFDIFGLTVKAGLRGGGVKLPSAQKG